MQPVRWGIVGTGHMADTMAREIVALRAEGHHLAAVVSRDATRGAAFCARHGAVYCADVATLVTRDDIDIVYVASPHTAHAEHAITCLKANKAVLCEKPFTTNTDEAQRVYAAWRSGSAFLMEAMWTRFLPAIDALRAHLASETIGRIQLVVGGGAFLPALAREHYLLDPHRAGGVLLDAGVYLVAFASLVLGTPHRVLASAVRGATGIDEQDAAILEYPNGERALVYVSMRARRAPDLELIGDGGRICVHAPVFRPTQLTVTRADGVEQRYEYPINGSGYGYQLQHCAAQIRRGERESALMPVAESLAIMQTLDTLRVQMQLSFPHESRIGVTR
jgi:predicted dehydrogenase